MMSALRTELGDLKIVNEEQKSQLLVKDGELADMQAQKVKMLAELADLQSMVDRLIDDHEKILTTEQDKVHQLEADMQAQKVKMQAEVDNLAAQLLRAHVDHGKPDYKPATTDVEPADQGGVWSSDSGTHRWVPDKIEIR
jgi:chromosome segregation ATPase